MAKNVSRQKQAIGSIASMTNKQLNKLTTALALEGICDPNSVIIATIPAFASSYADAQSHVTNIQSLWLAQAQNTSGIAEDKRQARLAMCNIALVTAGAIHAYATKIKNNALANEMDFSLSDLMAGRDTESARRCQEIYDTANANLTALADYGLTAAKLNLLKASIAAYNLLITKPREVRAKGKTTTGNIQAEFDLLDETLVIMDDLIPQFAPANQKFVDDYNNARTIVDTSASHASPTPPTPTPPTGLK
jgi:hypothetical protein